MTKMTIMTRLEDAMPESVPHEASIAEAKSRLSKWVRQAEHGEAVLITRRGRPVAALVSAGDLAALQRLRAAGPDAGLAGLAGGWDGSDELVERVGSHSRTPPRDVPSGD